MNNKKNGKPFAKKKGSTGKNSESKDSDKRSFKTRKNSSDSPNSFSTRKSNSGGKFSKRGSSSETSKDRKFTDERKSSSNRKSGTDLNPGRKKDSFSGRKKFSGDSEKKFSPKKLDGNSDRKRKDDNSPEKRNFDRKSGKPFTKNFTKGPGSNERPSSEMKKFSKTAKKPSGVFEKKNFDDKAKRPSYDITPPKRARKEEPSDGKIRLNKYIANSGICSRRDADELISLGEVTVNGKIVTELGLKVSKDDVVTLNGRKLTPEKHVYVLLNKPKDFITTTDDPQERKTVMSLVQNACKERILPVGRLDRNTTGLLLFTNDGDLAEALTHPRKKIKKIYQADLDKPITKEDFEKILNGLRLEDGAVKVDALAIVSADKKSVGIEIHEGRNRIVRRIFESLGYEVLRLDRVMYAGLTKKDLPRGNWRYLTEKEVVRLKYF